MAYHCTSSVTIILFCLCVFFRDRWMHQCGVYCGGETRVFLLVVSMGKFTSGDLGRKLKKCLILKEV